MQIEWKKQEAAWVGRIPFVDGRAGSIVLVGPRTNPKGAVVVLPAQNGETVKTLPLSDTLDSLHPASVVAILAMQECMFGNSGLLPL